MNFTCNAVNILASVFQFNDKTMDPNFTGACFIDLELDRKLKLVKNKSNSLRKSSNLLWHCGNIKKSLDTFSIFFWPSQNIWTLPETPSTYWPQYSNSMTRPWTPIFQEPVLLTWSLTGNPSWFRFFSKLYDLIKINELYLQRCQHIGLSIPIQWQDHGPQFSRSLFSQLLKNSQVNSNGRIERLMCNFHLMGYYCSPNLSSHQNST